MITVSSFVKLTKDHKSASGKDWKDFPCSQGDIGQVIELLPDGRLQLRLETVEGLYTKVSRDEVAECDYTPKAPPPPPKLGRSSYRRDSLPSYEEVLEEGLE